jgi:hypothetical protein
LHRRAFTQAAGVAASAAAAAKEDDELTELSLMMPADFTHNIASSQMSSKR